MGFVQDFTILDRPYEEVAAEVRGGIGVLLGAGIEETRAEGERLRVKVAPAGWPGVLAKTVEVRSGPVRARGNGQVVGFSWEAARGASLFPRLDADLEVAPFGIGETVLEIQARYEPPAGPLGRGSDRLLLHRLAESTVRAFLHAIASNLAGHP
jgi:hypothetical protein